MYTNQVVPYDDKTIFGLSNILGDSIGAFEGAVNSLDAKSLVVTDGSGSDIAMILEGVGDDEELKRKFLTKVNVETASQREHCEALKGFANNRDIENVVLLLESGFDPGAIGESGYNSLQTPVEQNQIINGSKDRKETARGFNNMRKDAAVIKMYFSTGKIDGYEGEKGKAEAEKIRKLEEENIGNLQQYCGVMREYFSQFHNKKIAAHTPNVNTVSIGYGREYLVEQSNVKTGTDQVRKEEVENGVPNNSANSVPNNSPQGSWFARFCQIISGHSRN